MIEILVNGSTLDVPNNISIPLELNNPLFATAGERRTSFSYSFRLPTSNTNRLILGFPEVVDVENAPTAYDAIVRFNGIDLLVGDLVVRELSNLEYKVNLQVTKSSFMDAKNLQQSVGDPDIWPPANYTFHYPKYQRDNTNNSGTAVNLYNDGIEEAPFPILRNFLEETFKVNGWSISINWDARFDDLLYYDTGLFLAGNPHKFLYSDVLRMVDVLSETEKRFCLTSFIDYAEQRIEITENEAVFNNAGEQEYEFATNYSVQQFEKASNYTFAFQEGKDVLIPFIDPTPYEPFYEEHILDLGLEENTEIPLNSYFFPTKDGSPDRLYYNNYLLGGNSTLDDIKLNIKTAPFRATYDTGTWNLTASGITAEKWEKWAKILSRSRLMSRVLYMNATEFATFRFQDFVVVDGNLFFALRLQVSIRNVNRTANYKFPVKADLILIR